VDGGGKLRGTFKQHEDARMLPLPVLGGMRAVLAPTAQAVLDAAAGMKDIGDGQRSAVLESVAKQRFYNTSALTFETMLHGRQERCGDSGGHTTVAPSEDPKPVRAVYDLAAGTGGMLVGDRRPGTPSAGDRRSGVCVDRGGEPVARHVRLLLGAAARDPAENAEPLAARVRSHGAVGRRLSRERVERMTAHHH
jgi:hypothetical protein